MMSSPVHHPKDLDPALMYAPPWVRSTRGARGFVRRRVGVARVSDDEERWGWGDGEEKVEPRFAGDRAMLALRRKLSLDPAAVPVPPGLNDGIPIERIALRLCAVACVGALVAWVLTSNVIPAAPPPSTAKPLRNDPTMAAAEPAFAARTVRLISFRVPAEEQPARAAAIANAEESAPPYVSAAPQQVDTALADQPAMESARAAAAPALGQDEIARLVERGKSYLLDGDIAAARLLLQRAAEAGSAEAALALGSSFDPHVIARLGAIGVTSDPRKAREWYEKAAQLGSPIAPRQLALLGDEHS
jgi:hypothetical protein